jgi:hypothetical protein
MYLFIYVVSEPHTQKKKKHGSTRDFMYNFSGLKMDIASHPLFG